MFQCKRCKKDFNNYESLRKHSSRMHKISSELCYREFYLDGNEPSPIYCKCGCGKITTYKGFGKWYDYCKGHVARVHNNWGHNQKAIDASSKTRRKQFESGKRTTWNKGLGLDDPRVAENIKKVNTAERALKISKALSGKEHSDEHTKNWKEVMQKYWNNPEYRNKLSLSAIKRMIEYSQVRTSKLETDFENLLKELKIEYKRSYYITDSNKSSIFDFKLLHKPILIEIDGDWYHCNPDLNIKPLYEIQIKNVSNDLIKNEQAKRHGYILLRFWEHDIKNNRISVVKQLLEAIENQKT